MHFRAPHATLNQKNFQNSPNCNHLWAIFRVYLSSRNVTFWLYMANNWMRFDFVKGMLHFLRIFIVFLFIFPSVFHPFFVGVPHAWYLSGQSLLTRLNLVWRELDMVAMNNWTKNCISLKRTIPSHTTDERINQNCAHQLVSVNERLACHLCGRTHYLKGIWFSVAKTQLFSSFKKIKQYKKTERCIGKFVADMLSLLSKKTSI